MTIFDMFDIISILTLFTLGCYLIGRFFKFFLLFGLSACVAYSVTTWSYQLHSLFL
jgi:hypothetical protein